MLASYLFWGKMAEPRRGVGLPRPKTVIGCWGSPGRGLAPPNFGTSLHLSKGGASPRPYGVPPKTTGFPL